MNKVGSYNLGALGILPAGPVGVGQVALANEGAFAATFLSKPLTDYATGWKTPDGALEKFLEFMAPGVKTSHRFEFRAGKNANAFGMVADNGDIRALYGEFALVKSVGDVVQSKTFSKGLTTVIEKNDEIAGEREQKVAWLKKMLLRAECYRAWQLLNTAATNTAKTWGSTATPDMDIMAAITAFGDAVGIDANRVLFGSTAWAKRIGAYQAHAGNMLAPQGMDGLGNFLAADVLVSKERYTTSSGKSAIASTNTVMVFHGENGASKEDASTLKRFWTPEAGGGEFATYVDEITNPALVKITVCHTSNIVATCTTGVQKLTIS